jgi:ABC-type branched-subunit amino acid transport system permease subunit
MRALAAAVLARMTSLPRAVIAGIGIGVVEKVVAWNYAVGEVELVLFAIVLGGLLLQHRGGTRDEESSSWSLGQVIRPVPRALQGLAIVRAMNWGALAAFVAVAALVPQLLSNSQTFAATSVLTFAIVGLSVTILTGYGGQISLGQIGFFGIGAATSYQLTVELYVPFWLSLLLSGVAGAVAAVLIGLPALRVRGLYLTVTTLAFALVAQKWLISQDWMAGSGVTSPRPYWGSLDFVSQRAYYYVALAGLLFAMLLCRNVLRSGTGRNLLAVRDNEQQSAAFTVSIVRTKLTAFALSGFLAAFAGAIYGHGIQNFQVSNFPVSDSLRVVSMTIIGGLGSIPGTLLGSFLVIGIDRLVDVAYVRLLTTSIGLLLLLLYLPGGLGQLLYAARDRLLERVGRRAGIDVDEAEQVAEVEPSEVVPALAGAELAAVT